MIYCPEAYGSAEYFNDPYPVLTRIRDAGKPCYYARGSSWLVSDYDSVTSVLRNLTMSKQITPNPQSALERSVLFLNPPDHTRLRSLLSQAFSPRRIAELENRIEAISNLLLDRVENQHSMDFVADYALPLPMMLIAEMLGVPERDLDKLQQWSSNLIEASGIFCEPEMSGKLLAGAIGDMTGYFGELIEQSRTQPADNILCDLIGVHDAGAHLEMNELIGTCMLLLIAGHETTVNLLGNGMLTLLRNPDQMQLLRRRPDMLPGAIEEMLRFESPVQQGTFRVTTRAVEIGGQQIEAGQQIVVLIGAANRDPERFPEPDAFRIDRSPNRHLAFGLGIHFCLGASLARAEARIGFEAVLRRLPSIALKGTAESPTGMKSRLHGLLMQLRGRHEQPIGAVQEQTFRQNTVVRSLLSLPVTW